MTATIKCHHPERVYQISTVQVEREAFAHIRSHCETCGAVFRFVGVDPAHDTRAPGVNRTATEIVLPMVEVAE